jgi:uncharacterized protein YoxC
VKRLILVGCFVFLGIFIALVLPSFAGLDSQTYNNLMTSRDALLKQQDYLKDEYGKVQDQINTLQDKQSRINDYLNSTADALRDVNNALSQSGN